MTEQVTNGDFEHVKSKTESFTLLSRHRHEFPIEMLKSNQDDFPVFYVPLAKNDARLINNLLLQVTECSPDEEIVKVRLTQNENHGGLRELSLDNVFAEDGMLKLSGVGMIVLRGIGVNGKAKLYFAFAKGVDIHSPGHKAEKNWMLQRFGIGFN